MATLDPVPNSNKVPKPLTQFRMNKRLWEKFEAEARSQRISVEVALGRAVAVWLRKQEEKRGK